jgi:hypothetical protein
MNDTLNTMIAEPYHLPECLMNLEYAVRVCICYELRACEQRVQSNALRQAKWSLKELEKNMANWSSDETRAATDVFPQLTADQWMWAQYGVGRSLQVIRVLSHNGTENGTTMTEAD